MRLPVLSVEALLLLGLRSSVMGSKIPINNRDTLQIDATAPDLTVKIGEPDFTILEKPRSLQLSGGAEDPEPLLLLPRSLNKDQTEALRLHNAARAKKKLKALAWDTKLQADADKWAKHLAKTGDFEHAPSSQRPNQGENIAYVWSSGTISNPMTIATNDWLAEAKKYHGEVIPKGDFSSYGHYTQIMWKSCTKVGIATASDGKGAWYTVARYSPPGNVVGQKPY